MTIPISHVLYLKRALRAAYDTTSGGMHLSTQGNDDGLSERP